MDTHLSSQPLSLPRVVHVSLQPLVLSSLLVELGLLDFEVLFTEKEGEKGRRVGPLEFDPSLLKTRVVRQTHMMHLLPVLSETNQVGVPVGHLGRSSGFLSLTEEFLRSHGSEGGDLILREEGAEGRGTR